MSTGDFISRIRKQSGFSQEALAERSGLSLRTIQRIETGATAARPFTLKAIADALSVQVTDFDPPGGQVPSSESSLSLLRLINSSALLVLIFPLLNILVPYLLWRKHAKRTNLADPGKKIISFQILWTVISILMVIAGQMIAYRLTGQQFIGKFSPALVIYLVLVCVNVLFVIRASLKLRSGTAGIYRSIPSFF